MIIHLLRIYLRKTRKHNMGNICMIIFYSTACNHEKIETIYNLYIENIDRLVTYFLMDYSVEVKMNGQFLYHESAM